ncbi:MAG: cation-translocating P-type ATPase [Micrococcales bacterium]
MTWVSGIGRYQISDTKLVGLSESEAKSKLDFEGPNELPSEKPKNLIQQIWSVIKQPMLLLLLVAGAINFALAEPLDGIILMLFVLVVIGISIYQERKSEKALSALRELSSPQATVIRDGIMRKIPSRELVVSDLVVLSEGDRIPADGYLVEGSLQADESTLTGESISVRKVAAMVAQTTMQRPGGDATEWLYCGTLAVRGRAKMIVLATGAKTEIGQIGTALREIETEPTNLQKEVDRLVRVIAVIGVLAAVSVAVIYGLTRADWLKGSLAGIATAMAMLPEEFPVVLTVFLALGAWRLSKVHVLTRRSEVIETLGSATVICVDKTGTITQNRMQIKQLIPQPKISETEVSIAAYLASAPEPFDPMDKAFREAGAKLSPDLSEYRLIREYPLTDALLAVTQVWDTGAGDYLVACKGAPEVVAKLAKVSDLEAEIENATSAGSRVLGVAKASWPRDKELPENVAEFDLSLQGLACLYDPVREGVPAAIAEAKSAGVRTVMITGDYPGTARAIANEIGLDTGGGIITGEELARLNDVELALRIRTVNVFARMIPEQKLQLIRALKANGEIVAMTGDGVNDSPALRAADIGIAMGARGTDVAREAASLVLTDDNFNSIVAGVKQGRTIFENMRKALTYVIAVHIPILGMTLIPVIGPNWPLVLVPVLIALLELIIDPACSVVFESEAAAKDTMQRKPRSVNSKLFDKQSLWLAVMQGLAGLAAVVGVYVFAIVSALPSDTVRSMAFVTLVVTNLLLILINRSNKLTALGALRKQANPTVKWVLAGATVFLILVTNLDFLRSAFKLGALSITEWLISISAGLFAMVWFDLKKFYSPG